MSSDKPTILDVSEKEKDQRNFQESESNSESDVEVNAKNHDGTEIHNIEVNFSYAAEHTRRSEMMTHH